MAKSGELIKKATIAFQEKRPDEYNRTSYLTGFYEGYWACEKDNEKSKKSKVKTTVGKLATVGIGKKKQE